jgi:predicted metal-dependent hydrolase
VCVTRLGQASLWYGSSAAPEFDGRPVAPRRARLREAPPAAPASDEEARIALEIQIAQHVPDGRLALALTDNRYTMISVKREKGLFRLRLHHMFLDAAPEVVRALADYVAHNDREASRLLGRFIDVNQRKIRRPRRVHRPAPQVLETRGEVHDLQDIYAALNQRYFAGAIDARITWGQRAAADTPKKRRSSMKMGSYSVEDRLIRIHPSLDRPFVPRMFVEWIVYHEMLHQKHDIPVRGGRRQFHTPAFLAEEARFGEFHRARLWERAHLDLLLYY